MLPFSLIVEGTTLVGLYVVPFRRCSDRVGLIRFCARCDSALRCEPGSAAKSCSLKVQLELLMLLSSGSTFGSIASRLRRIDSMDTSKKANTHPARGVNLMPRAGKVLAFFVGHYEVYIHFTTALRFSVTIWWRTIRAETPVGPSKSNATLFHLFCKTALRFC